jgi:hypothetical protein
MSEKAFLLVGDLIILLLIIPSQVSDVRYWLRYGYVPRSWRKSDRILKEDEPFYFWLQTKGRLIAMAVVAIGWLGITAKVFL